MNVRLVMRLTGAVVIFFTLSMLTMVPFAMWYGEWTELTGIVEAMGVGILFGAALWFGGRAPSDDLFRREALAVVGLSWLLIAAVGALPLQLAGMVDTYTDAYFESMSGLTTTGSTILTDIESNAHCLLFWRSFLHFVGGLGIIVFFVAILPILGVGGKALFKQEVPGPVPEGFTPRIKDTALALAKIYVGLNVLEFFLLRLAGMNWFESLNHAMATMATGGFSTNNASIFGFVSPLIEWIVILFMFLAGTNFSLHLRFVRGDFTVFFKDVEFRVYVGLVLLVAFLFSTIVWFVEVPAPGVSEFGAFNFRDGLFTSIAIMTTTGFGTIDFDMWPPVAKIILLLLMFVGGMAGSTAGGIKLIRWIILAKTATHELNMEVSPRQIRILKIGSQPLPRALQQEILTFFFIYLAIFGLGSIFLALLMPDQDLVSTITAVVSALNNIGPGLADVGPTMNFAGQSDLAKWLLSLLMVCGRLELYAILLLFAPSFWRGR